MSKIYFQTDTKFSYTKDGELTGLASSYEEAAKLADKGMIGPGYINPVQEYFVTINGEKIYAQHELWFDYTHDGERKLASSYEEAAKLADVGKTGPGYIHPVQQHFVTINSEKIYAQHEYHYSSDQPGGLVSDNLYIEI